MTLRKTYRVEHKGKPPLGWFMCGPQYETLAYCQGYVHGIKSAYPCPAVRIVCEQTGEVVREESENGRVTLNAAR